MARRKKSQFKLQAAARAREGKAKKIVARKALEISSESENDERETSWAGGVNNHEYAQSDWSGWGDSSDEEIEELTDNALLRSLKAAYEHEQSQIAKHVVTAVKKNPTVNAIELITGENPTKMDWQKAESNRHLGYIEF